MEASYWGGGGGSLIKVSTAKVPVGLVDLPWTLVLG